MNVFGQTRSRIERNYALITPDTHVISPRLGWKNTEAVVHISPEMGARFTQFTMRLMAGAISAPPADGVQRFFYVREGSCSLTMKSSTESSAESTIESTIESTTEIAAGGFAFIPANTAHQITAQESAQLVVFEKPYQPHADYAAPVPIIGDSNQIMGEPFMGDPDARLQTLLPVIPEFDMAVNIFTYQPGATLPQVEIHVMEHGLMMLAGQGVYRLGEHYFPVAAGDVIWMASYCPQWFVAMGKTPASYIYYKDIHRES